MIFIFSYEREEMLTQVLNTLSDYEPIVIDDGSSFFIPNCIRYDTKGSKGFGRNGEMHLRCVETRTMISFYSWVMTF